MKAEDVTAVIVTRGNVDLQPIFDTLPYPEIIVWDNSVKETDYKCYGRYLGATEASNDVVYFQDDDLLFTRHDELLAAWGPGKLIANMPSPWYEACSYDRHRQALPGGGSLCPKGLWNEPFATYLTHWPFDDLFLDYCDFIFGIQAPHVRYDWGFEVLPHADDPGRIYNSPGALSKKKMAMGRASHIPWTPTTYDAHWYDWAMTEPNAPAMAPLPNSPWLPSYTEVAQLLDPWERVVDLGCGTGRFEKLLLERGHTGTIEAVDWSPAALAEAEAYCSGPITWTQCDLDQWVPVTDDPGIVYVCLEVLEHLEHDRELVAKVPRGCRLLFTVPDFWDHAHVHVFAEFDDVLDRYRDLLDFRRWIRSGKLHVVESRRQ